MREGTGGADTLARELVTDIGGSVAVAEYRSAARIKGVAIERVEYPTQANLVSALPYFDFTSLTHLGTASLEKAMCFFFPDTVSKFD